MRRNDAQVRIFTVRSEIPFAGHPNVGTAFVLATQAAKAAGATEVRGEGRARAGRNPDASRARVIGAELTAPQPLKRLAQFGAEQAAACLSLSAGDVKTDRHAPQIVSRRTAVPGGGIGLARGAAAGEAGRGGVRQDLSLRRRDAVYFYTRDVPADEKPCDLQARMFHPGASGLSEDPATGSATAAAAALLADLDATRDGELKLRIGQGVDMGRPSLLLTRVRQAGRRSGLRACRRRLRADDGRHVSAGGRGVSAMLQNGRHAGSRVRCRCPAMTRWATPAAPPNSPPSRRRGPR